MTFQVRLEQDHTTGSMWLQASHNGTAWSNIELRTPAEAKAVADALQEALMGKMGNPNHAWDCFVHDGYGLCNCGALLRGE